MATRGLQADGAGSPLEVRPRTTGEVLDDAWDVALADGPALLVRGFERAERVGHAMRCRGFDGRFRTLTEFRTRPADVVAFLALFGAAVGLWLLDRVWG